MKPKQYITLKLMYKEFYSIFMFIFLNKKATIILAIKYNHTKALDY